MQAMQKNKSNLKKWHSVSLFHSIEILPDRLLSVQYSFVLNR